MRVAIARQVATLLPQRLREGGRLGVAWSRTLMHLPDALEELPQADVVQLVGPLSAPGHSTAQSSALVHTLGSHAGGQVRSEEHTSELQSRGHLVCRHL